MAKRKYYHIQIRISNGSYDVWHSPIEGQFVIKSYWEGYKAAIKFYYPCSSLRLINAETEEVVEYIPGNGSVGV